MAYTDEEMMAAAKEYGIKVPQQSQTQAPQFSDEDMMAAAKEYGIKVPEPQTPAPSAPPVPTYTPPPLTGQIESTPPPPLYTPPPYNYQGPPLLNLQPGQANPNIQDGMDFAGNVGVGIANGAFNVGRGVDALWGLNPLEAGRRALMGHEDPQIAYDKIKNALHVSPDSESNKLPRDIGGFIGAAAVTPALGGGMTGPLAERMLSAGLEGGAISGTMEAGKQLSEGKFNPLNLAAAPLVGSVAGAGSGALMAGGAALFNKLAPELAKRSEAAAMKAEEKAWQEYEKAATATNGSQTGSPIAQNITPQVPQPMPTAQQGLGSYEEQVRRGLIDVEDQAVHKMLTGQVSAENHIPEPPHPAPPSTPTPQARTSPTKPIAGDVRYNLSRDAKNNEIKGYDRVQTGTPLANISDDILNAEEKQKIERLAKAQLFQKVAERHRDAFAQELHDRGVIELSAAGTKYTLKAKDPKAMLKREGQIELDNKKYELSDALKDPKGSPVRVQVDQAAIDQPFHYEILNGKVHSIEYKPPTGDATKDAIRLKHLVETTKFYGKLEQQARKEAQPIIEAAHKRVRFKDPQDNFAVQVPVGPHKVLVEHQNQRQEKAFHKELWDDLARKNKWTADEAAAEQQKYFEQVARDLGGSAEDWVKVMNQSAAKLKQFKDAAANIKSLYGYTKKQAPSIQSKAVNAAIGATGLAAINANQQEANAYTEGSDPNTRANNLAKALGTSLGGALLLYGAAKGTGMTPKVMQKWIKSGMALSMKTLGDSKDAVEALDKELGTDMAQQWMMHEAAIDAGRWGVVFKDKDMALAGREELRKGLVAPADALNGSASFSKLTDPERKQIVSEYLNEKTLGRKLAAFTEQAKTWYKALPAEDQVQFSLEMMHLNAMARAMKHEGSTKDPMSALVSSGMRYLFELNPEFQLTNLTDALIAGGSRIGPKNMARAYKLLASNGDIQKLFLNANLVGGVKAERQAMTAQSGFRPVWENLDFMNSDMFNANRVMLGSFLSSFKKSQTLHNTTASEMDYLKAVISGQATKGVSQDAIDHAWIEGVDNGMRTLSANDTLRLNHNTVTLVPGARYFAAFVNQPARISRLVGEYAKNKEYGKMSTFLIVMTLLGGRAAIPRSARAIWESHDPDSAKAAESTLDQISIWNMAGNTVLTGNPFTREGADPRAAKLVGMVQGSMADKIGYDAGALPYIPAYMSYGSEHPSLEAATKLGSQTADIVREARSGDPAKQWKAAKQAVTIAGMLGLFGRFPVGSVGRAMTIGEQMVQQKMPVYYYDEQGKQYAPKDEIDLKQFGPLGMLLPAIDKIVPGKPALIDASQQAKYEQYTRKQAPADVRPPRQMMYQSPPL